MRVTARRRIHVALISIIVAATAAPLLLLTHVPRPFADVQLYASIARARYLYGIGVPTMTWHSPAAVDHIPFYGPVFYDLSAAAMHLFGLSLLSFRLVSTLGTALYVAGTVMLARQFTSSVERVLLAVAIVLLAPDVNYGMATGAMHMLAIGCETLALSSFVGHFDRRRGGARHGLAAGLWLSLAALTTPRSYPFVLAFFAAGLAPSIYGSATKAVRYRLLVVAGVFSAVMLAWMFRSHGGPARWFRYMAFIATHEDTDVALLATTDRTVAFHLSGVLTPLPTIAFGLLAAWSIRRGPPPGDGADAGRVESRDGALSFLIACTWLALVATATVLNYTFLTGEYIVLPMFAVVVAWPWSVLRVPRRVTAAAMGLLLCVEAACIVYRYACIAPRWSAHAREPVNAFVAKYVPPGSAVAGPPEPFFFPVEQSGSRFRTVSPRSWADWARWVPLIEPEATLIVRRFPEPPPRERFLIWQVIDEIPDGYGCATPIARYDAPPPDTRFPAWLVRQSSNYPGYPSAVLYRLPPGCPTGYDPTRPSWVPQ